MLLVAVLLVALALTGCLPAAPPPPPASDGSPGSAGVPIMGQSRLTADDLVAHYQKRSGLAYRASGATLQQLAQMFITEGNRYNVRGDLAFAQSIVETAWFNYPDNGMVRPYNNNFSGIGACDTCGNGFQFSSALAGVRAQLQLLRNYADSESSTATIPDPPVPELWGSNPSTAAYNFDHYFAKGRAPLWNNMGNGNWATAPNYATVVLSVYNQMLTDSGQPGQCPADGLLFGPLTAAGPCPVGLRQPGRAIATTAAGGWYVLNGNGVVTAYNGAPFFGSPPLADSDAYRDIAVMPDGQGYVVMDKQGLISKFGSATSPSTVGSLWMGFYLGQDVARSIAVMPDGMGYLFVLGDGTILKYGSAATGAIGALGQPSWPGGDVARSIAVMPDGAGYLVLDNLGGVYKYGSALQGRVGAGSTKYFGVDIARDIVVVFGFGSALGYEVLDAWGGVADSGILGPRSNPAFTLFRDRWRGIAMYGTQLLLLRNDGTTQVTN
ncbi:MAG TPA: glucosaminidase domain-containing protein [Acidimicrobiia bacterium]